MSRERRRKVVAAQGRQQLTDAAGRTLLTASGERRQLLAPDPWRWAELTSYLPHLQAF